MAEDDVKTDDTQTPPTGDTVKDEKPVVPTDDKTKDQGTSKEDTPKDEVPKTGDKPDDKTDDKSDDKRDDKSGDTDEDVWGSTGDDVGDSVLDMLKEAGTTPDTAKALLWDAVKEGDVTKIDRDALVEAVGKARANLVMAGMENYVGKIAARTKEVTEAVHSAVDGADNWSAIRTWAQEALSADEMVDYAELIDKGGRRASLAAKDLADRYVEAGNTLVKAEGTITPAGKAQPPKVEPLSRIDYFNAVNKLHKTGKADESSLNQLWKQRELGKSRGL